MINKATIQNELMKCRKLRSKIVRQLKTCPSDTLFTKLEHGAPRLYTYSNGKPRYLSQNSFSTFTEISTARILHFFMQQLSGNIEALELLRSQYTPLADIFKLENISPVLQEIRHDIRGIKTEKPGMINCCNICMKNFFQLSRGALPNVISECGFPFHITAILTARNRKSTAHPEAYMSVPNLNFLSQHSLNI